MRIGQIWHKMASHDYWNAWTEIIQYHSFSVKDAELRLKSCHNFDGWIKNNPERVNKRTKEQ